jgi:hypothetical protein
MRHPAGNDRDVTHVHGANVAIDFELALDDDHDLLFLVDMHRSLGVRFERDEVEHRELTKDRSELESGQELGGFD